MKTLAECRLYAFIDSTCLHGRDPLELARQLAGGGADLIQLRAKEWTPAQILTLAEQLAAVLQHTETLLVINDHPEIARAAGAPLCHLGQEDFFGAGCSHRSQPPHLAPPLQFGLSTHAPPQALRAAAAGADYIAIGPVFATPTKPTAAPVTLDYVRWAAGNVQVPWFAIGGITLENLDDVLQAGARRVCVVSAILNAAKPADACQRFRDRLRSAAK